MSPILAFALVCVLPSLVTNPAPVSVASPNPAPGLFRDEMDSPFLWSLPGSANDPFITADAPGVLTMTMPQVPVGFPYSYQWGAATRTVVINTETAPILVARVSRVSDGGYAHLDIEMRDYSGAVVKGIRSPALQGAGLSAVNLQDEFGKGLLRLTIRLIVGGANSGAWVDYDYLRAVSVADFATLQKVPASIKANPVPTTPAVLRRKRR